MTVTWEVEAFGPTGIRRGWINDFWWLDVVKRYNRRDTATVAFPMDHTRAAAIVEPGTQIRITRRREGTTPLVFTGTGTGFRKPEDQYAVECYFEGDWGVFDVLAWPKPAAAIGAQDVPYYEATGPAETVIKGLVQANVVARLGRPVTIAPDQGRGATVSTQVRFASLAEEIERLADLGGIGVDIHRVWPGWALDCWTPTDRRTRVISERAGTLTDWSWEVNWPTATRCVAGGPGEGTMRALTTRVTAGEETAWGVVKETFVDASGAADPTALAAMGDEGLLEGRATSGFSLTVTENGALIYGQNLQVGDLVKVETLPGTYVEDVVREVHLSMSVDEGPKVTPLVGWSSQSPAQVLAKRIHRMSRALRKLATV